MAPVEPGPPERARAMPALADHTATNQATRSPLTGVKPARRGATSGQSPETKSRPVLRQVVRGGPLRSATSCVWTVSIAFGTTDPFLAIFPGRAD